MVAAVTNLHDEPVPTANVKNADALGIDIEPYSEVDRL